MKVFFLEAPNLFYLTLSMTSSHLECEKCCRLQTKRKPLLRGLNEVFATFGIIVKGIYTEWFGKLLTFLILPIFLIP